MALFKKDRGSADSAAGTPSEHAGASAAGSQKAATETRGESMAGTGTAQQKNDVDSGRETALLGKGTRIAGKLSFEGKATIEGEVEGEITCNGTLLIGESALVSAAVEATNVIIHGKVTGDITATRKLEIRAPGKLFGNVATPSLVIEEGVVFEGHCSMGAKEERGKKVTLLASEEKPAESAAGQSARAGERA